MDWIVQNSSKFAFCIVGIIISVLLPPLWDYVRARLDPATPASKGIGDTIRTVWSYISPYAVLGLASALTSIIVVAAAGDKISVPEGAILAGYAWDSTLQKLQKPR